MYSCSRFSIMRLDREYRTRNVHLLDFQGRQVMYMSVYEIVMICIASVGLLLKLIEAVTGRNQK